jgi:kynureninase
MKSPLNPPVLEYYQQHQEEIEEYIAAWWSQKERLQAEQDHNPSPGVARLHKLKKVYVQKKQADVTASRGIE